MKKIVIISSVLFMFSISGYAQIGGLKKLIPKKETEVKSDNKTDTKMESSTGSSAKNDKGEYKTQGITSDVHRSNVGKVLFAPKRESIAFQKEIGSDFKSSFTFGEEIYFRAYLENSLSNFFIKKHPEMDRALINKEAFYTVYFYFDGVLEKKTKIYKNQFQEHQKQEWTSFKGALDNGPSGGEDFLWGDFDNFLRELDGKLSNGTHKIKIEFRPTIENQTLIELETVASGEIDYEVTPTSIRKDDETFCLKKALMKDAVLEGKIMKLFAAEKGNEGTSAKFCRIILKDWDIIRNDLTGRILRRNLRAIVVATNKEGKYFYKTCFLSQEYVGGKFLETIEFSCDDYQYRVNSRCIN